MDLVQRERWEQLSTGLARTGFSHWTPERQAKLQDAILHFIDLCVANFGLEQICDWDGNYGECYLCDEMSRYLFDERYEFDTEGYVKRCRDRRKRHWDECGTGRFGRAIAACVRAGFDMAVRPSAGVIGFTVGNLRDALGGEIPDWVAQHFKQPEKLTTADPGEGIWL